MSESVIAVFFYGLFMDKSVLASLGISPLTATPGYIDDYALRIGERATLIPKPGNRAYGMLMTLRAQDVSTLYAEKSVADYVAETVTVLLPDGRRVSAVCYNLPAGKLQGTNTRYATALLALAGKLGLPADYLEEIRKQAR